MNRAFYAFVLSKIGLANARSIAGEFPFKRFSMEAILHEHYLQELEKGLADNKTYHELSHKGHCCKRTVGRRKAKYLGKKK